MSDPAGFWSRRRAAVAAEERARRAADEAQQQAQQQAALEAELDTLPEAQLLSRLGLKPPEDLTAGDDFSAYLARAVPQYLRDRALAMLWRSNPVLANLDGLVEYGLDYTDKAVVRPGMQTAYQVGKGMTAHVQALAEKAERLAQAAAEGQGAAPGTAGAVGNAAGGDAVAVGAAGKDAVSGDAVSGDAAFGDAASGNAVSGDRAPSSSVMLSRGGDGAGPAAATDWTTATAAPGQPLPDTTPDTTAAKGVAPVAADRPDPASPATGAHADPVPRHMRFTFPSKES
ncbi:DUF3306 domain-containing protein [Paracoccus jiaweipingae]|uniref:DUF3306 domain-containing protein n=1 Tax=unclassified Paracoccus (in: a-proteobacteria) TaxID=2688777 RepID=UPI00379EFA40